MLIKATVFQVFKSGALKGLTDYFEIVGDSEKWKVGTEYDVPKAPFSPSGYHAIIVKTEPVTTIQQ